MQRSRTSRALVPVAIAMSLAVGSGACSTIDVGSGSTTCRKGSATVTVFQGPSGQCISKALMVGYRCDGQAPQVVLDAGGANERRYVGGGFAVSVPRLPADSQVLGVGEGSQLVVTPDDDRWLYMVHGTDVERWLPLPEAREIEPSGAQAFMIGDSILFGGQFAITEALPAWTVGYDALDGRGSASGVAIAESQADAAHDVVVVELGTNDDSVDAFRDAARRTLNALSAVPLVLWQTVKGPDDVVPSDEINTAITELAGSRPNVAIADWENLVRDEELGYDGVHPAEDHQDAMAKIVAPMLTRWWNAVTADELRCGT